MRPSFFCYCIFRCIKRYMEVYAGIWKHLEVYGGMWKYIKVYESIWKYIGYIEQNRPLLKPINLKPINLYINLNLSRGKGEGWDGESVQIYAIYLCILLYTFTYLDIPSHTPKYLFIPLCTPIYFKISNITQMRADIRPKNGHNSGPSASPRLRIWPVASYNVPRGSATPKGCQN